MLLIISLSLNLLMSVWIVKELVFRYWLNGQLTTMLSDMRDHKDMIRAATGNKDIPGYP